MSEEEELLEEEEAATREEEQGQPSIQYVYGRYVCPKCGRIVPFFVAANENSGWVRCPACGSAVGRKQVPPESIIVDEELFNIVKRRRTSLRDVVRIAIEKGYMGDVTLEEVMEDMSQDQEKQVEQQPAVTGEQRSEEKPRRPPELFERPKTPCEVLQEVLEEFRLKEDFTQVMVRRCERVGSIHPIELLHYLTTMKSGVRTQGEAQFIAEEYAAALRAEMERAKQLNMPYPPIVITEPVTPSSPAASRLLQLVPPSGSSAGQQQTTAIQGYGRPPVPQQQSIQMPAINQTLDVGSLLRGVAELIKSVTSSNQQQQQTSDLSTLIAFMNQQMQAQMQMQKEQLNMVMQNIQQQIRDFANSISEGMKSLSEAFKEVSKTTKEMMSQKQVDPELLYKAAKAEAEKEYLEKLLEISKDQQDKLLKHVSDLQKKLEEAITLSSSRAVEGFQTDQARLVAQAITQATQTVNRLVDVLDKRQPVKIIVESLPYLTGAGRKKKIPEKYKEVETTGVEEVMSELEEMGLVEEQEAGRE